MILLDIDKTTLVLEKDCTDLYFTEINNNSYKRINLYKLTDNYRINDYLEYKILYILYDLIINRNKFINIILPFNFNIYICKYQYERKEGISIVDIGHNQPVFYIKQEYYDYILSNIVGSIYDY